MCDIYSDILPKDTQYTIRAPVCVFESRGGGAINTETDKCTCLDKPVKGLKITGPNDGGFESLEQASS